MNRDNYTFYVTRHGEHVGTKVYTCFSEKEAYERIEAGIEDDQEYELEEVTPAD